MRDRAPALDRRLGVWSEPMSVATVEDSNRHLNTVFHFDPWSIKGQFPGLTEVKPLTPSQGSMSQYCTWIYVISDLSRYCCKTDDGDFPSL